jgi:hypothetical protein
MHFLESQSLQTANKDQKETALFALIRWIPVRCFQDQQPSIRNQFDVSTFKSNTSKPKKAETSFAAEYQTYLQFE